MIVRNPSIDAVMLWNVFNYITQIPPGKSLPKHCSLLCLKKIQTCGADTYHNAANG